MKTLGHRVIKFIESYCVHSTGDYLGKPFVLRDWQKEILLDMFEIREDGSFIKKDGILTEETIKELILS